MCSSQKSSDKVACTKRMQWKAEKRLLLPLPAPDITSQAPPISISWPNAKKQIKPQGQSADLCLLTYRANPPLHATAIIRLRAASKTYPPQWDMTNQCRSRAHRGGGQLSASYLYVQPQIYTRRIFLLAKFDFCDTFQERHFLFFFPKHQNISTI